MAESAVYEVDPLTDPRWCDFVETHPHASIFHSRGWLQSLSGTYGYKPIVFTTSPPTSALRNGIVFCDVNSWLTGRRFVSLPFSDHCEPLVDDPKEARMLFAALDQQIRSKTLRYIESRPLRTTGAPSALFESRAPYYLHQLDLRPSIGCLFSQFHRDSTQRKIRRAEREGLGYQQGRTTDLLEAFCQLFLMTRQKHRVPPQPKSWFRNLLHHCGPNLQIRVAFKSDVPVAAIITLQHNHTIVYKYGGSDARFHSLGGMHLLFWRTIQEAKAAGLELYDLGRTACENAGLATFKARWGARQFTIHYSRFTRTPSSPCAFRQNPARALRFAQYALGCVPRALWYPLGTLLYKHIG